MVASSIIVVLVVSTIISTSEVVLLERSIGEGARASLVSKLRSTNRSELLHLLRIGLLGHHHLRESLHWHVGVVAIEWIASKLSRVIGLLRHTHSHVLGPEYLLLNHACGNSRIIHIGSYCHRLRLNSLLRLNLFFLVFLLL